MILNNRHIIIFKLSGIIIGSVAGFFMGVGIPTLLAYISIWRGTDKTALGGIFPFVLLGALIGPIIGLTIGYFIAGKITKKQKNKQYQRFRRTRASDDYSSRGKR